MLADHVVKDVIAQLLDLNDEHLTTDTALAALAGWDSVNALRVLVYLERELGAPVDYERFMSASTLADMAAVVADVQSGLAP
jgi:acyl carrier protein